MRISDWSSDVCSSDLDAERRKGRFLAGNGFMADARTGRTAVAGPPRSPVGRALERLQPTNEAGPQCGARGSQNASGQCLQTNVEYEPAQSDAPSGSTGSAFCQHGKWPAIPRGEREML